jgi:hypothetical protein
VDSALTLIRPATLDRPAVGPGFDVRPGERFPCLAGLIGAEGVGHAGIVTAADRKSRNPVMACSVAIFVRNKGVPPVPAMCPNKKPGIQKVL